MMHRTGLFLASTVVVGLALLIWILSIPQVVEELPASFEKQKSEKQEAGDKRSSRSTIVELPVSDETHEHTTTSVPSQKHESKVVDRYLKQVEGEQETIERDDDRREKEANIRTAARLASFMDTGDTSELDQISREDIDSFADFVIDNFDREDVAEFAWAHGRIPAQIIPCKKFQLKQFLIGWYHSLRGNEKETNGHEAKSTVSGGYVAFLGNYDNTYGRGDEGTYEPTGTVGLAPIYVGFSNELDEYGQIVATAPSFPEQTATIYGIFENRGPAKRLSHVMAIWRDASNKVLFQECEPIHPGAGSNYVWLHLEDGWPRGIYRLEICDPKDRFAVLGSGTFEIE